MAEGGGRGDMQLMAPPAASGDQSTQLIASTAPRVDTPEQRAKDAEDLEEKLHAIQENVPTRIFNVCGSAAGAGSGDFHQYRMIRRREQMRLRRIDEEFARRKGDEEVREKLARRNAAEEVRTSRKRAKRQKRKERRKAARLASQGGEGKRGGTADDGEGEESGQDSDEGPGQVELD
eukprot:evm.model.scf_3264.2 EVM.evm.TU.scf_3264.2   scf_3264:8619-9375(-)